MWKRLLPLLGIVLLLSATRGAYALAPQPPSPSPGRRLITYDASHIVVEWTTPEIEVATHTGRTLVTALGYHLSEASGHPQLPLTTTLIALPPNVTPEVTVLSRTESMVPLRAPLTLAPPPDPVPRELSNTPLYEAFTPALDEPPEPEGSTFTLDEIGTMRGVRLARLTFRPVRQEHDALRVTHRLRVEVRWPSGGQETGEPTDQVEAAMLAQIRAAVLNPTAAVPTYATISTVNSTTASDPTAVFLDVPEAGRYRVTYDEIAAFGLTKVNPHHLQLYRGEDEVSCGWEGDEDALFEPGEALYFYGAPRFSRWTRSDAYRLVIGTKPGRRITTRSGDPTGLPHGTAWSEAVFEENMIYTPDCFCGPLPAGRDGDRWVWDNLHTPGQTARAYDFELTSVDPDEPTLLTVRLISYTDVEAAPDHRVEVAINGVDVGEMTWEGRAARAGQFAVPAGVAREGTNELRLTLPGLVGVSVEGTWLDAFAIRYARSTDPAGASAHVGGAPAPYAAGPAPTMPYTLRLPLVAHGFHPAGRVYTIALDQPGPYHAYDVTDPLHPLRLTGVRTVGNQVIVGDNAAGAGRRYLVTCDAETMRPTMRPAESPWTFAGGSPVTGVHHLIIAHPSMAPALKPLVDLREEQGLSTAVVNVLGIYDAWGDGRPDPEAIRAFIAEAYATWDPRPTYLLLVGDGSFDPRGYRESSPPTLIPPYLASTDRWAGETASDNRYACVDGDDTLPDLMLGRLPVDSPAEAQAAVEKIIAYETVAAPDNWHARVLLVADDPDRGGDFIASSELVAGLIPPSFTVTRHYCSGEDPLASDCAPGDVASLQNEVMADWNSGALLLQFTGHASWQQWAAERLIHLDDLEGLVNHERLPIVLGMTCFTSAFHRPEPTLDESLVTSASGGAVATWGATGMGVDTGHSDLAHGFYRAVFSTNVQRIGEATLAGKLHLATAGRLPDLLDTFILLGDPATTFQRPSTTSR